MTAQQKRDAIASGRAYLRDWLTSNEGALYYTIRSARSGAHHTITLHKVVGGRLERLWPNAGQLGAEAIDVIARDWGFDLKRRAFAVCGGGMNMVFHLAYTLHGMVMDLPGYAPFAMPETFHLEAI